MKDRKSFQLKIISHCYSANVSLRWSRYYTRHSASKWRLLCRRNVWRGAADCSVLASATEHPFFPNDCRSTHRSCRG